MAKILGSGIDFDWAAAGIGLLNILKDFEQDNVKRARVRQREQFNQALIKIQKNALGSKFAMENYQNLMQENVALGVYASSLSKSRIGVAGTAPPGITAIQTQYQQQRDVLLLQQTEQLAKLQLSELSSELTEKAHREKTTLTRLGGMVNQLDDIFGDSISGFLNFFRTDDSDHVFRDIGRADDYETKSFDIGV